ncbi:type-F conjugative transfer system pilin assembly protein TrbC [Raoultella ornithinolytica]|uniref:type-F conjugative transfer system pilin assembly protein TrbC n=1 Tax=Raoultella ornithinolytica TaxID=54291 RepID=UPI00255B36C2|nr:type-F conjugative transfer system pilin assembly protein TrbC [Raoultella ornithinolytica]MDL4585346.1 type-F conjugative transfer system pilin assembly protein TrbC [Raoultella ornithinolytica]MDV1095644.1 type-F conjugative transfer system pilin assembly protein TrbC [Raoultella ornithinolytica]MDV1123195.1 type-F conjugative transfer system pilin assembly protein TrbC [Raoultella ornithinolytica]MDV1893555.1 type-F conjugative transfer system pilin assembly protein TrbC [Raoultella ornit
MNSKTFTVLVGALMVAVCAQADGLTDEQQLFRALREQSAAIRQLPRNPATMPDINTLLQDKLPGADRQWISDMQRRVQSSVAPGSEARPDALYFLSFSIPEEGLKQMVPAATRFHIPALINGLVDNNFRKTVELVFRLARENNQGGVQIDPRQFSKYGITTVPALVVICDAGYDRLTGNLKLKEALERIAAEGDCADTAKKLLQEGAS